jgi:hypothetical protein
MLVLSRVFVMVGVLLQDAAEDKVGADGVVEHSREPGRNRGGQAGRKALRTLNVRGEEVRRKRPRGVR